MPRDFNQNRIANAYLKSKNGINAPGVYYAVKDNADGYNVVSVSSLPSVELFIGQGTSYQDDITEWTIFNSQAAFGGVGANAFARFQNLESITIWQEDTDNLLVIDDNAFYSNVELAHIYVHPDLLARYQTTYSGKSFVSLFEAYELITDLIVPTSFNSEVAPTTLTKAWLDLVFANMPLIERNAKTTVIVPDYFTGIDSNAFSGLGSSFSYLNEIKCNGTKTFNAGFLNGASWCIHLWLDNGTSTFSGAYVNDGTTVLNANFRTLAPYLVFANYSMSEYPSHYPVVGYNQFSSGDDLPRTSPTGEYLWFSNINFDADYESHTGLENDPSYVDDYEASTSGYYYCYGKIEILVIQDDGTHVLTSTLVQASINGLDTPKEWITKVVIPDTFISYEENCLSNFSSLTNLNELEWNYTENTRTYKVFTYYSTFVWNKITIISCGNYNSMSFREAKTNHLIIKNKDNVSPSYYSYATQPRLGITSNAVQNSVEIDNGISIDGESNLLAYVSIYLVRLGSNQGFNGPYINSKENSKLWIFNDNTVREFTQTSETYDKTAFVYVTYNMLISYMTSIVWSSSTHLFNALTGFFTYDGTLPTFTGYTPTFYEDEDCTITITEQDMVVDTQYYVKLA